MEIRQFDASADSEKQRYLDATISVEGRSTPPSQTIKLLVNSGDEQNFQIDFGKGHEAARFKPPHVPRVLTELT